MGSQDGQTWIPNPSGDSLPDKKPFTIHKIDGMPGSMGGSVFGDPELDAVWDAAEAGQFELAEAYFKKYGVLDQETEEQYVEVELENLDNGRVLKRHGRGPDGKPDWSIAPFRGLPEVR